MSLFSKIKDSLLISRNVSHFEKLSSSFHNIVFFAESKNDWIHFEGVILELIRTQEITYLTSDQDDPSLNFSNKNFRSFYIGAGFHRTILFKKINVKIFIMTLPDLESFHLKRSIYPVHYVYLFHSIVSSHMVYRKAAFDAYDTIFLVGEHHQREIRENENIHGLKKKNLFNFGYYRLEKITSEAKSKEMIEDKSKEFSILLAPSWGIGSITETCLEEIIAQLEILNCKVIVRPHPMSLRPPKTIQKTLIKYERSKRIFFDLDIRGTESFFNSDIMISEWSGVALEYAFGLNKPVIFIDTPKKINNKAFEKFKNRPIEDSIRDEIGSIIPMSHINNLNAMIKKIKLNYSDYTKKIGELKYKYVFNIGHSSNRGAEKITTLLKERRE